MCAIKHPLSYLFGGRGLWGGVDIGTCFLALETSIVILFDYVLMLDYTHVCIANRKCVRGVVCECMMSSFIDST